MKINNIIRIIYLIIMFSFYNYAQEEFNYPWPIRDFNTQHTVTGTFGECRGDGVVNEFHRGIDICMDGKNIPVYPVLDGTVNSWTTEGETETLILKDDYECSYTYAHLENVPTIIKVENYPVTAGETIIGYVHTEESNHLHFTDGTKYGDKFNPLYYIIPFSDNTPPVIDWIKVIKNYNPLNDDSYTELSKNTNGHYKINEDNLIDIIVKAHDAVSTYGGTNNGIFEIYVTITGPLNTIFSNPVTFQSIVFDDDFFGYAGPVKYIYAPGSATGTNIYTPTNGYSWDNYWNPKDYWDGVYEVVVTIMDISQNITDNSSNPIYLDWNCSAEQKNYTKRGK